MNPETPQQTPVAPPPAPAPQATPTASPEPAPTPTPTTAPTPTPAPAPAPAGPEGVNYKQIMDQILGQLKERKGLLFKRVLVNVAPILLAIIVVYIIDQFNVDTNALVEDTSTGIAVFAGVLAFGLFAWLWISITSIIFKTERTIWIDSFFDNVSLEPRQSLKIAFKLFWPSVLLRLGIFFRYYALAIVATVGVMVGGVFLGFQIDGSTGAFVSLGAVLAALIGLIVYSFILQIRLRYVWFIFLDAYNTPDFSHARIFTKMKELNKQLKSGDIQRIVITTLGTDFAGAVAGTAIDGVSHGLSHLGSAGRAAGAITSVVGDTMVQVSKDYAKQVSYYMYYRLARQALYGADDKGSVSLYGDDISRG